MSPGGADDVHGTCSVMRGWLFFNNEIADHVPEAAEIKRFIEAGKKRGLTLDVLKPGDFDWENIFGKVGVRWLHEILVTFASQEAGSSITNIPFSQKSTVPVFGLDIGFSFDLGPRAYVGMDTGIRYQNAAKQFDYLLGLTQIDDSDGRWTAPVTVVVGVRF